MPTSKAAAVWEGGLKDGTGEYVAGSGAFSGRYSFRTRFEGDPGTNPEELIAAAHAACLSMALAAGLERAGTPPLRIATTAACTIEKVEAGFRITRMRFEVRGSVPGIDPATFERSVQEAKEGCPVSNALVGNVAMSVTATLE